MFDKILQISLLFDFYGQLLTCKQQEILQLYYTHDFSLGEIAEELNISRQAVYDTIKRSEKLLNGYEEKLGLVSKFNATETQIREIIKIVEDIEKASKELKEGQQKLLEEIMKIKKISYDILEK